MNKTFAIFVMAMLLLPMAAVAKLEPTPLLIQVGDGLANGFYVITIANLNTGESIIQSTADHGFLLYGSIETIPELVVTPGNTIRFTIRSSSVDYLYAGTEEEIDIILPTTAPPSTTTTTTTTTTTLPSTTTTTTSSTTTTTLPVEPEQDWAQFLIGGVVALFAWLVVKFAPYKGKVKVERVTTTKGTFIKTMAYQAYVKRDGTTGYHWVTKSQVKV